MVKRASDGMVIRYGEGGAKLEGAELTKFMGQLNDYLGFFDKVQKRLRNEEVTRTFAELFAQVECDVWQPARMACLACSDHCSG